jgi:hypothetical protein
MVEPEKTSIARQRLGKYVHEATNMQEIIEKLLVNSVLCWFQPEAT